jgi:predicted O-methyltransferase YrrM
MKKNPLRVWIKRAFNGLMDDVLEMESKNIEQARQRRALEQTAEFVEDNLPSAPSFDSRYNLLRHIVKFIPATENGLVCEFGVAGGKSINFLSKLMPERTLHGFDSFEGLPEDWASRLPKGAFKQAMPKVEANVRLYKGWFSESLPPFLAENTGKADFLNIDCDLYSSTKTVFELFAPRIQPGTVIYFDEFFNYAGWRDGEFKAFMEFIKSSGMGFEYLGYNSRGTQLAVRMK